MPGIAAIEACGIKFTFSDNRTATVADFVAKRGLITCLHGSNGTGKSVLIGLLAGRPLPRQIGLEGSLIAKSGENQTYQLDQLSDDDPRSTDYRGEVSVVFQRLGATLFALQDQDDLGVAFEGAAGTEAERLPRLRQVLEILGQQTVFQRSGHQRSFAQTRLLEFACAASTGQPVYVFDEPFQGLDEESAKSLRTLLAWLASQERIVLISAHSEMVATEFPAVSVLNVAVTDTPEGSNPFDVVIAEAAKRLKTAPVKPLLPDTDVTIEPEKGEMIHARLKGLNGGRINWLVASNGHGKSAVAAALGGLIRRRGILRRHPDGFHVEMPDWPHRSIPNPDVHVVLQNPYLSFIENRLAHDMPEEFVSQYGTLWGGLNRKPVTFSFGQLRFLQLLLIPRTARLVILDEPLIGLATENQQKILCFLRNLPQSGRAVICTALSEASAADGEVCVQL